MKADFSKVQIQADLGKEPETKDLRHDVANLIHCKTYDIGTDELARRIYHAEGEVDITDEQMKEIEPYFKGYFTPLYYKAIVKAIK